MARHRPRTRAIPGAAFGVGLMTNANHKAKIRQRMAETGEPYMQARRRIMETQAAERKAEQQPGEQQADEPPPAT